MAVVAWLSQTEKYKKNVSIQVNALHNLHKNSDKKSKHLNDH